MDYVTLIIFGIAVVYIAMGLRIAAQNERFAVFILGRFAGFKGPGLVFCLPGSTSKFVRVALGAEGDIQSNELVLIAKHAMPYRASGPVAVGNKVRLSGFDANAVRVDALQHVVDREKCGHKNVVP